MFNSNNVITHEICQGLMASGSWIMSRQTHFFDVSCQLLETFFDISDEQNEIGADRDEQVWAQTISIWERTITDEKYLLSDVSIPSVNLDSTWLFFNI